MTASDSRKQPFAVDCSEQDHGYTRAAVEDQERWRAPIHAMRKLMDGRQYKAAHAGVS